MLQNFLSRDCLAGPFDFIPHCRQRSKTDLQIFQFRGENSENVWECFVALQTQAKRLLLETIGAHIAEQLNSSLSYAVKLTTSHLTS